MGVRKWGGPAYSLSLGFRITSLPSFGSASQTAEMDNGIYIPWWSSWESGMDIIDEADVLYFYV